MLGRPTRHLAASRQGREPFNQWTDASGAVLFIEENDGELRVGARAMDGVAERRFPGLEYDVRVYDVYHHPDLILYGGPERCLDVDLPGKTGSRDVTVPVRVSCEQIHRTPRSFLMTIRFLGPPSPTG